MELTINNFYGHLLIKAVRGAGGAADIAIDDITVSKGECTKGSFAF